MTLNRYIVYSLSKLLISKFGVSLSANGGLDVPVGVRQRVEQVVVVLDALPRQVEQHVVLVGQSVRDLLDFRNLFQDQLRHVVHGGLH